MPDFSSHMYMWRTLARLCMAVTLAINTEISLTFMNASVLVSYSCLQGDLYIANTQLQTTVLWCLTVVTW